MHEADECIGVGTNAVGTLLVMRATTLKATAGALAGLVAYYADLADRPSPNGRGPVDYYLDPDEPSGRWWGDGRRWLGVDGVVTGDELRAVLVGRHPSGRALTSQK